MVFLAHCRVTLVDPGSGSVCLVRIGSARTGTLFLSDLEMHSIFSCLEGVPAGRKTRSKHSPPTAASDGQLSPFFSSGFLR